MHVARLFDREVALIDGAEALGTEAHLLFERQRAEELFDPALRLGIKIRIDTVPFDDGEADLVQRVAELHGEGALVAGVTMEKAADVDGADLEIVVELILIQPFGELVGLVLLDLVVTDEVLVGGADSFFLAGHARSIIPRNGCETRWWLPCGRDERGRAGGRWRSSHLEAFRPRGGSAGALAARAGVAGR